VGLGKTGQAVGVLNDLAPTEQVGYPPAQLWRAKRLLAEARSSPKGLATAERLLGFVLQSAPENIEANALLDEVSQANICKSSVLGIVGQFLGCECHSPMYSSIPSVRMPAHNMLYFPRYFPTIVIIWTPSQPILN
jgi:hypothetical protein